MCAAGTKSAAGALNRCEKAAMEAFIEENDHR
jgi:hypothetical protein